MSDDDTTVEPDETAASSLESSSSDVADTDADESPAASKRRLPLPAVLAVAVVVVALVAAGVVYAVHRHGRLPADAVFRYQGHTYVQSDLAHYDELQHALYGIAVPDLSQSAARREAAQTYAVSLVIDHSADHAGVSVSSAEVSQAESDFITRAYPSGRPAFINALAAEGLSENDVLDELRRQLVIKQLYDSVTQHVTVSAAEVVAAYHQHVGDFVDPPTRLVSEIVLGQRGAALALKGRLRHGLDFAATAKKESLDSTTSSKGGSLGYVAKSQLQGPFGSATFAAKPGQVFGPIKATGASYYYLGLVTQVRPGRTEPLSQVRNQLSQELAAARGLSTWETYLKQQITAAGVEYSGSYRPADPDAVPTGTASSSAPTSAPSATPSSPSDGTSH